MSPLLGFIYTDFPSETNYGIGLTQSVSSQRLHFCRGSSFLRRSQLYFCVYHLHSGRSKQFCKVWKVFIWSDHVFILLSSVDRQLQCDAAESTPGQETWDLISSQILPLLAVQTVIYILGVYFFICRWGLTFTKVWYEEIWCEKKFDKLNDVLRHLKS